MIIAIDHGNGYIKTPEFVFPTGVEEVKSAPLLNQGVLEIQNRTYVVGGGRQPLKMDKTTDDDYYLLTLAAIAKELQQKSLKSGLISLAVGLPLGKMGTGRQAFIDYLKRDGTEVAYKFEGKSYSIKIRDVYVFPQGLAAIQEMHLTERSYAVVDIGSWTVDALTIHASTPNAKSLLSLESGMIRCNQDIREKLRRTFNMSVSDEQISDVLMGYGSSLSQEILEAIEIEAVVYLKNLFSELLENGYDFRALPVMFVGGGATLVKNMTEKHKELQSFTTRVGFVLDTRGNAIGYATLLNAILGGAGSVGGKAKKRQ